MKMDTWQRKLGAVPTTPGTRTAPARRTEAWRDRLEGFVWLTFGTIEIWIGLRILLRAIGANPENPIARFIYETSAVPLAPFEGLTRNPTFDGMVLEVHSLVALLIVGLVGWIVIRSIDVLFPPVAPAP